MESQQVNLQLSVPKEVKYEEMRKRPATNVTDKTVARVPKRIKE